MSDQTLDTRVDSLLRDALKAEAASLPLRVTSDQSWIAPGSAAAPVLVHAKPSRDCRWRSRPAPPQS